MDISAKTCANVSCGVTGSREWKNGWLLRSGDFASLCFTCGSAYENGVYCETFHAKEAGWRGCSTCSKVLHCGCISSKSYIHILDYGGVDCSSCVRNSKLKSKASNDEKLDEVCKLVDARQNQAERGSRSLGKCGDEVGLCFSNYIQRESHFPHLEKLRSMLGMGDTRGSPDPPSLSISLSAPLHVPADKEADQQESKHRSLPFKSVSPDPPKCSPEPRIARPPAEGRGKNQLLPRYWPRITDQELQQLSGDLNSKIVPLFEKVLSASDAGRIGRLVLPKACAEAYFPPISQSEGVPIRIQDIKGREWMFQFRFWPNNNSRMYVLEGVTPCIQSMQLRAGDTITFSQIDPGGRLVLGYRKVANNAEPQEENPDSYAANADFTWSKNDAVSEKKKAKNIGSKNKRLVINNEDAMELRTTWDAAQSLLCPPPNVAPTTVTIDDHDFEEYDEPPVFGKSTLFTSHASGAQEQWAQCDTCSKWRKLPLEAVLYAPWACADNVWDSDRHTCEAEEEENPMSTDSATALPDVKKRKIRESRKETEVCGLDALASAVEMGEGGGEEAVGVTTKHPRHRAGCSCIVCIQPPSGKGKHKPTCTCNVCMTVKRRFRTLMQRKKKRQSERERERGERRNELVLEGNKGGSPREIDLNYFPHREEETVGRGDVNVAGSCSTVRLLSDQDAFFASIGWERGTK